MRLIDADELKKGMKARQDACAEWRDTANDDDKIRADAVLSAFIEFKLTLDKMPTIEQPHWIPCKEKMPEIGEFVLVTYKWINVGIDVSIDRFMGDGWLLSGTVTAWMPLPEPFKEAEE